MRTPTGQHLPGFKKFHVAATGWHWTQGNMMATPKKTFIEIIMTQMAAFVHPSVRRSRVMAKLVLDRDEAVTWKTAMTVMRWKVSIMVPIE
jgi:hypothetical protein